MNVTHVTIFFRACLSSNWFRSHSSLFLVMFLRVLLLIQMMLLLGMINNFTVSEHGTVQYYIIKVDTVHQLEAKSFLQNLSDVKKIERVFRLFSLIPFD